MILKVFEVDKGCYKHRMYFKTIFVGCLFEMQQCNWFIYTKSKPKF